MPRHRSFWFILTLVDTFTGRIEAYPTAKETADVVASTLLEHIVPRFGLPRTIQSDNGPAFVSKVVQLVSEALHITWKLHIPYRPQSSDKIERANRLLKDQLTKLSLQARLSWPTLLPLVLICLQSSPGLSPFELLYRGPFLLTHDLPIIPPSIDLLSIYLISLSSGVYSDSTPDLCLPAPATDPATRPSSSNTDPLSLGDQVLLKELQPLSLEPRWSGPHPVILTTRTAAKLLGHQCWYHLTRLKRAPPHDAWNASVKSPGSRSTIYFYLHMLISPPKSGPQTPILFAPGQQEAARFDSAPLYQRGTAQFPPDHHPF